MLHQPRAADNLQVGKRARGSWLGDRKAVGRRRKGTLPNDLEKTVELALFWFCRQGCAFPSWCLAPNSPDWEVPAGRVAGQQSIVFMMLTAENRSFPTVADCRISIVLSNCDAGVASFAPGNMDRAMAPGAGNRLPVPCERIRSTAMNDPAYVCRDQIRCTIARNDDATAAGFSEITACPTPSLSSKRAAHDQVQWVVRDSPDQHRCRGFRFVRIEP